MSPRRLDSLKAKRLGRWWPTGVTTATPLRETIKAQGTEPIIPGRKNRQEAVVYDKHCYGSRHVIENFFCRLKDHRRVATRYEKTAPMFGVIVMLSCILVWLQA